VVRLTAVVSALLAAIVLVLGGTGAANAAAEAAEAAESGGDLAPAPRTLEELSQKGAQMDRNGLPQAGRALQTHAYRPGNTVYPKVPGAELNSAGQDVLDDILTTH